MQEENQESTVTQRLKKEGIPRRLERKAGEQLDRGQEQQLWTKDRPLEFKT